MSEQYDEVSVLIEKSKRLIDQLEEAKAEAKQFRRLYYKADHALSMIEDMVDNEELTPATRLCEMREIINEYAS